MSSVERCAIGFELRGEPVRVALVVIGGDEFILAARKKFHEVVQKLPGFGEPAVFVEFEPLEIPPQQNPVIDLVDHQPLGRGVFQKAFAERVKRGERDIFPAFASGAHHARLHLPRRFVRKRQPENIFSGKRFIRLQQMPNPLRDDARLPGSRSRNHQQRPFSVRDRAPLRVVQFQPALSRRLKIKQSCHDSRRVAEFAW